MWVSYVKTHASGPCTSGASTGPGTGGHYYVVVGPKAWVFFLCLFSFLGASENYTKEKERKNKQNKQTTKTNTTQTNKHNKPGTIGPHLWEINTIKTILSARLARFGLARVDGLRHDLRDTHVLAHETHTRCTNLHKPVRTCPNHFEPLCFAAQGVYLV